MKRWAVPWGLHWIAMKAVERRVFRQNRVEVPFERRMEYYRSPEWESKALVVKQARPWCGVCNRDYRKKGLHLEAHHLPEGYEDFGHEYPDQIIPLCGDHHPEGQYPLADIRRDRRRYLRAKYLRLRNWLRWTWELVRDLALGRR